MASNAVRASGRCHCEPVTDVTGVAIRFPVQAPSNIYVGADIIRPLQALPYTPVGADIIRPLLALPYTPVGADIIRPLLALPIFVSSPAMESWNASLLPGIFVVQFVRTDPWRSNYLVAVSLLFARPKRSDKKNAV